MTKSFQTALPDDSLVKTLRRIMGEQGAQLVPVMDGERIVGIVTPQNLSQSMGLLNQSRRMKRRGKLVAALNRQSSPGSTRMKTDQELTGQENGAKTAQANARASGSRWRRGFILWPRPLAIWRTSRCAHCECYGR